MNNLSDEQIFMKYGKGRHKKRGPSDKIRMYCESLIKKAELSDEEMANTVRAKFPTASTTVKCIQWYRCQMRKSGILPPAPKRVAKPKPPVIKYEVICLHGDGIEENTYTSAALIKVCQAYLIKDGAEKKVAKDTVYSVPTAVYFLDTQGYEVVEVEL